MALVRSLIYPNRSCLPLILDRAQQGELVIIRKSEDVSFAVDGSILCNEAVIYLIECVLYFLEINRVILMGLDVDNLQQRSTDFAQSLDSFGLHAV